jgi:hypothetical protein
MQLSPRRELIVKREEIEKEIAALFVTKAPRWRGRAAGGLYAPFG